MNYEETYCYEENNDTYPLCKGKTHPNKKTITNCDDCCLYEDMKNEGGYDYYDK